MDKRLVGSYVAIMLFIFLFYSQNLSALMPPNIKSSIPENEGILLGDTVRFYGYSLNYGDTENLKVIDLTTGDELETSSDLTCVSEGKGNSEGCVQLECILAITLKENIPMHEYEISFVDSNIEGFYPTFHFFGSDEDIGEDNDLDGITNKQGDCDDNDPEIYPGAVELCSDNVDRDCDGNHSICCESVNNGGGGGSGGGCFVDTLIY